MATQVSVLELSDWLSNQPDNTVDTPYELEVTGISSGSLLTTLTSALKQNPTKYVDLSNTSINYGETTFRDCTSMVVSPILPDSIYSLQSYFSGCSSLKVVTNLPVPTGTKRMDYCFYRCASLTSVPAIPDIVKNMFYCFYGCTSLTTAPVIPDTVTDMSSCFRNCTSLTTAPVIPDTVTNMQDCFFGCTSLVTIPKLSNSVIYLQACFRGCTSLTTAPVIPDTVTGMVDCFLGCTSLVTIPNISNSVTEMAECFAECTSLTTIPPLPNSVTNLYRCFFRCTSLTIAPNIPSSVTVMQECFEDCTSLTTVPNIPKSVTDLRWCFNHCNNLTTVNNFQASKDVLENNAANCFNGCYSLAKVVVGYDETTDWHVFRLNFGSTNVSGKVYDKNGTAVAIPTTTITKSKLVMPVLSDELLFTSTISDADLDDLIADILEYKYTYTTKEAIDPTKKSFVLWADNSDNVVTNLSFPADVSHASGVLPVAHGGTGQTTQANVNKAIIGAMDTGSSDVTDGTEFVSSYASDNGFSDTNAPNVPYKRTFLKVWNYIKGKISSVLGLTVSAYGGKAATAGTADTAGTVDGYHADVTSGSNLIRVTRGSDCGANKVGYYAGMASFDADGATKWWHILSMDWSGSTDNPTDWVSQFLLPTRQGGVPKYRRNNASGTAIGSSTWHDFITDENGLSGYCETAGATQAKVAKLRSGFAFANGQVFLITFANANSCNAKITLNVNGTGAKDIWINGAVSSSSNKTLPAGTYLCQIDGGVYKIETSWGAPYARSAASASSASAASKVVGNYTGSGGQQNPQYIGFNRVCFNMMNTTINGDSSYKDFLLMDCYNGFDVGGATAFGISRTALKAFIMRSDAGTSPNRPAKWIASAELIHSGNISSQSVNYATSAGSASSATNATKLGNVSVQSSSIGGTTTETGSHWSYVKKAMFTTTGGYIVYSNGLIIQWGSITKNEYRSTVKFSVSYSSKNSYSILCNEESVQSGDITYAISVNRVSASQAYIVTYASNHGNNCKLWIAIGY